jgi:SAM-dependent methyltransferase
VRQLRPFQEAVAAAKPNAEHCETIRASNPLPLQPTTPDSPPRKRLHMGCGQTYLDGWINCDGAPSARIFSLLPQPMRLLLKRSGLIGKETQSFWRFLETHRITYVNARKKWPFANESIDIIYSSHLIDCFGTPHVRHFFQQAYRVLKPGGEIRLAGMNLAREVQIYLQQEDAERLVSLISFPNPNEGSLPTRLRRALWPHITYRAHLDFGSYKKFLRQAGFEGIVNLQPGESTIAQLAPINLWQRHGESLYVEARKPAAGSAGTSGSPKAE